MKKLSTSLLLIVLFLGACTEKKPTLPPAPESAKAISDLVKGNSYDVADLALVSAFKINKENPYEWFQDIKDTTAFFRDYEKERRMFRLVFGADTTVRLTDKDNTISGNWLAEADKDDDGNEGLFLKISYADSTSNLYPGMTGPVIMTFRYKVLGIDESMLMLETPNSMNRRKVLALMKASGK